MWRRLWIIIKRTYLGYAEDDCAQLGAAISYYILFSIPPIAILIVAIFGIVLGGEGLRDDVVARVLDTVPLTSTEGRDRVEETLDGITRVSGPIAVLSVLGTVWTASAVFSSIRNALNRVWDVERRRPWAQGKLVDFGQIGVLASIMLASIVLTGFLRAVREISDDTFGPLASQNPLWELPPILLPALLTLATFTLLYRIVPARHPRWRDVMPGALFATVLFESLKNSFAIYVANFNNFDVVYGSLAGILLFLLYTFLSANILLLGAELSRTMQRYWSGDLDPEIYPTEDMPPVSTRLYRALRTLFVRD